MLDRLRANAVQCAEGCCWALSDGELVDCLTAVARAEQALAAARLHLIRQLDTRDVPSTQHATSSAAWLRDHLRVGLQTARRWVDLARALDQSPDLDQALSAGTVNVEQASVITSCVADLPPEVGIAAAAKAVAMLIDWAADFDPQALRKLGTRILAHVAPDIADEADARALARQEARAHAGRAFAVIHHGDGRVRLTGWLDAEAGAIVTAAVDSLCTPVPDDHRAPAQRRADALTEVCQLALRTTELPVNGGDRPQLAITIDYEQLRRQVGAGTLDTGERVTPGQLRRLACDAQILPAVLAGNGRILDLGRSRRLITGPLRRALVLRDGGCAFAGCDRPPRWCEGHHIRAWVDGGPTSLDNSVLLCGFHHRLIHCSDWVVRLGQDGRPEFIPPTDIDVTQRPRRNTYHRRQ